MLEHLLSSTTRAPPLRVAVAVNRYVVDRLYALALGHVARCSFAKLVLVIRERPPGDGPLQRLAAARARPHAGPIVAVYDQLDRALARRAGVLAGEVEIRDLVAGVPALDVFATHEGETAVYPDAALSRLEEQRLDVIIRCADDRVDGHAARAARYGFWSFRRGEPGAAGPAYFWEVAANRPVSRIALEVVSARHPEGAVVCEGFTETRCRASALSLAANRVRPDLLGSTFVIRKLKQLFEGGPAAIEPPAAPAQIVPPPESPASGAERRAMPTDLDVARFVVPRLAGKLRVKLMPRVIEHWRIGVRCGAAPTAGEAPSLSGETFRLLEAPRGRSYSEPFLVARGGTVHCFFEDRDVATQRSRISCAPVLPDGRFGEVEPVLERPYHVSYPFVFEDGSDVFMIPETAADRRVVLLRALEFPRRWEEVRTLLPGPGEDTTVVRRDGRYWFFVVLREPEDAGDQLLVYHATALDAELRPHPRNPITADVRYCRPGGAFLTDGGRLVRPVCDASVTLGRQLHFFDVEELTPDTYRERLVHTVPPPAGWAGIRTYNRCGAVEVVDGKWYERAARHRG